MLPFCVSFLKVEGKLTKLPYDNNQGVLAYKEDGFIVIQTYRFNLRYDGHQFLKLSACSNDMCGLCAIPDDSVSADIYYQTTKGYCTPNNGTIPF